jgi:hypothetical protein
MASETAEDPQCTLTLYSGTDGTMAGSTPIDFGDDQQLARFITDPSWIPGVASGFEGAGVLTCEAPVVATTLTQQASDNALATVAMIQTNEEPSNGGGDPTSGTALLPKLVKSLDLTSDQNLDVTLDAGVQIKGAITTGSISSGTSPEQFVFPQGVSANCSNMDYRGSVDLLGMYTVAVPKRTTCEVTINFTYVTDLEGGSSAGAAPAQEASTIFITEKMSSAVQVADTDVTRNFSTSPIQLETVDGNVTNLTSLPPALLQNDILLVFGSTDGQVTAYTFLAAGNDSRDYMIEVPDNRNYFANLQLFELDQAMNVQQVVAIYQLGSVDLAENTSPMSAGTTDTSKDFVVPATSTLSGTVSVAGQSGVPEQTFIAVRDTRFSDTSLAAQGLAGGLSSGLVQTSGAYSLTLVQNREYDLFTGIPVGDTGMWGIPAEFGDNVFSFNGPTMKDVVVPALAPMRTFSGRVEGPVLTTMAENEGKENVSVSVTCTEHPDTEKTISTESTLTDAQGNFSLSLPGGGVCEALFEVVTAPLFPGQEEPSEK